MNHRGEFTTHHRDGDQVVKLLDVPHPADARLVAAALAAGRTGAQNYLDVLRSVGVALPADLEVLTDAPLAVRHRWVFGPDLLDAVAPAPDLFVNAVCEIAQWVRDLASTDARIDTNLANFCLVDQHPVLVDVLPPLIPSRRLPPTNLFEVLFTALCFDTDTILAALVGYAARALLRAGQPTRATSFAEVGRQLCPPIDRPLDGPLANMWFRARAALALAALAGDMPTDTVDTFFALTSVRVFRELDEPQRTRRVEQVRDALSRLGLR